MNGIVALQPGLFPDIKNVFVPMESLDKVCERFNNNFLCHKRINHFPNTNEITRKDKLCLNISQMQEKFGKELFHVVPDTYILPDEFGDFY